jgi:hypothetical protein
MLWQSLGQRPGSGEARGCSDTQSVGLLSAQNQRAPGTDGASVYAYEVTLDLDMAGPSVAGGGVGPGWKCARYP